MDPNERFRARRDQIRRTKRRRRAAVMARLLGRRDRRRGGRDADRRRTDRREAAPTARRRASRRRLRRRRAPGRCRSRSAASTSPAALASLPGKLDEYVGYTRDGLTTIELDVKDEKGEIGFVPAGVPLAHRRCGPRATYYDPRQAARLAHRNGVYLIGRVVVFEDPLLARARPDLAMQASRRLASGRRTPGLGWVNPYDRRVWDYTSPSRSPPRGPASTRSCSTTCASRPTATSAARRLSGQDDGRAGGRSPTSSATPEKRLQPLRRPRLDGGVRALATRDLAIGQLPR